LTGLVTLDRGFELIKGYTAWHVKHLVQGVEFEEIMMRLDICSGQGPDIAIGQEAKLS
jgi:hypothetical protein